MRIQPLFFIILLLNIFQADLTAQVDKSNYELLWEISGNGLDHPSYLFGTIHLQDKRAFEFSDSLLVVLDACQAFAMEVHPDSAFLFYSEKYQHKDTTDHLRKMLSKEAYDRLKKELEKEKGIELDSLIVKDPDYIRDLFRPDPPKRLNDIDLYLDLYLYRMARRSGKYTYGLEKLTDHKNMTNVFFEKFKASPSFDLPQKVKKSMQEKRLESLVELYQKGNLSELEKLPGFYPSDSLENAAILVQRNTVMANNIDRIIKEHSLFATMGVAHLPGKDGVIDQLIKKGYRLRPLTATFTGKAAEFEIKEKRSAWHTYKKEYYRFNIEMPGEPYVWEYEETGRRFFDHYLNYNDIVEKNRYGVKVTYTYWDKEIPLDSFLIKEIEQLLFFNSKEIELETKFIELNGNQGVEFFSREDTSYFVHGRAFYHGSSLIIARVERKDNQLDHPDIERFFDSFFIEQPKSYGWKKFDSQEGAYSISLPFAPDNTEFEVPTVDAENNPIMAKLRISAVKDLENDHLYIVRYQNIGEGLYLESDSLIFEYGLQEFSTKFGDPDTVLTVLQNGYEGREMIYSNEHFYLRLLYIVRGGRIYLLLGQNIGSENNTASLDEFFNSFEFTPYEYSPLEQHQFEAQGFSVGLPKKPVIVYDTLHNYEYPNEFTFSAYGEDVKNGMTIFSGKSSYSRYFQVDTIDVWIDDIVTLIEEEADTVLLNESTMWDGFPGRYLQLQYPNSRSIFHNYFVLKGHDLFEIYFFAPHEIPKAKIDEILNSLQLDRAMPATNLTSRKIDLITSDMSSSDSLTRDKSETAFMNHSFVPEEMPYVYSMLHKEYEGDTLAWESKIRMLCNVFSVYPEGVSLDTLVHHYHKFPDNQIRQSELLSAIIEVDADDLSTYFEIFEAFEIDTTDQTVYGYSLVQPFRDSLALVEEHFDLLKKKYQAEPGWSNVICDLFLTVVKTDSIDHSFLLQDISLFMNRIRFIAEKEQLMELDSIDYFKDRSELFDLVELVSLMNLTEEDKKFMKNLLWTKDYGLSRLVAVTLVVLGEEIPKTYWNHIDSDPYYRFYLMESLFNKDLLKKLPKKWMNKKDIALRSFCYYAYDDYFEVALDKIEVVRTFNFNFKSIDHKVYVIRFPNEEEGGFYYGLTAQPIEKDMFEIPSKFYDFSYESILDKDVDTFIEKKLEWYRNNDDLSPD